MSRIVVLYADKDNVCYDEMSGATLHDSGGLILDGVNGDVVFIAPGQWITAEVFPDREGD